MRHEPKQIPRSCPACGEREPLPWRLATPAGREPALGEGYLLLRCRRCGTATLAGPPPDQQQLDLYEGGTYRASRASLEPLVEPLRRLVDRDRRRLLGPLSPGARVVEVGAGRGRLVATLVAGGHEATGIEPSRSSWLAARERGAPVENVGLADAEVQPQSCDVVVLWHVLEHLDDPAGALQRIRPWLKRSGRLVVAVPNLGSLQARLGGDRWFHQDVPRHRSHFTVGGLQRLLARSGFRPKPARHLIVEQNLLGMWLTLLNRLTVARDVPFRFLKRDLAYSRRRDALRDGIVSVVAGALLLPVALLLELGAGLARRGGTVVVEAVPDPS